MVSLVVNGRSVSVEAGTTILQAARKAGVEIPHLCHHPALPAVGSCRLCVVEIEGLAKLEPDCATAVREGMNVRTESPRIAEARRNVLEFLLAEHPPDCPICDKAGECRLQDDYQAYGLTRSRYAEEKSRREKKIPIGKKLLLDRERCVLCTRCVRFLETVTKTSELGVFERGARSEIGFFEGRPVDNNYSGCLAEICPVGAITDVDFRFRTRVWFLEERPTLCPLCGRGCPIDLGIDRRNPREPGRGRVVRVRSRPVDANGASWICDVGRYGYAYLEADRFAGLQGALAGGPELKTIRDVPRWLASHCRSLSLKGRQGRAVVVVSDWLTNEEMFLVKSVFEEDSGIRRFALAAPKEGAPDGFLLTAERSPNRAGAQSLGFRPEAVRLDDLVRETDLLVVFGPFLGEQASWSEIRAAFAGIKSKVLFTPRGGAFAEAFDLVVPTAWPAEKEGSFTNCRGIRQGFAAALPPPVEGCEEWRILLETGKALGRRARFYAGLHGVEDIRRAFS